MSEMEECQSLNRSFINEREDLKNRVRLILQKIETYSSESFVKDKLTEIKGYLKSLEKLDKNILSNIYKFDSLRDLYISDRDTSFQYKIDTEDKIALIADNLAKSLTPSVSSEQPVSPTVNPSENSSVNTPDRARPNLSLYRSAKEPPIQIGRFEGDEDDKLAFSRFLSKFKALIDNNSVYSDEEKLIHLISNLGHTAYDMVKHLSPEGHNYAVALDILKLEYLDKEFIVEKIFQQLYEIRTPQENNLATLKGYINEMKVLIYDLKSYGFDFLIPETPGFKMISSMIIYKLPPKFKNALIEKVQNNYPSILEIFEHSPTLLKRMELGQRPQPQLKHDNNFKNNRFGKHHNNSNNKNNNNGYKYNKFAHNNSGSQNKGSNNKSDPVPPLVNHLDLFLDKENILRSHGRISKSLHFNYEICNPILLAKIHPFTRLIILNAHSQVQHLGVQTTLNHIRNKGFWIPQARQAVKTVLSTCFLCKKIQCSLLQ